MLFLCPVQQLIMQKAAEELKKQQEKEAEEKRIAVAARVPKLDIDGLDESKSKHNYSLTVNLLIESL